MADQFLLDQITEIETIITNLNTVINTVLTGGHAQYSFDSGQTSQEVTRLDLGKLRLLYNDLITQRDALRSACGLNESVVNVRPGFGQ
jgi:hypothetical protein